MPRWVTSLSPSPKKNILNARFSYVLFYRGTFRGDLRVRYRPVGDHLADVGLRRLRVRGLAILPPRTRLEPPGTLEQAVPARRLPPHPRVVHRLLGCVPIPVIDVQQVIQQVLRARAKVLRPTGEAQREPRAQVGAVRYLLAIVVEG